MVNIYQIAIFAAVAVLGQHVVTAQEGASCHTGIITPAHFFNMTDYLGNWYMQSFSVADHEAVSEANFRCLSMNLTATSNPINYISTERYVSNIDNIPVQETSLVVIDNLRLPAYWRIWSNVGSVETETVMLHTDYISWAVQYGCSMSGTYRHENVVIWTRSRLIDDRLKTFLETLVYGYGFPDGHRAVVDQSNC